MIKMKKTQAPGIGLIIALAAVLIVVLLVVFLPFGEKTFFGQQYPKPASEARGPKLRGTLFIQQNGSAVTSITQGSSFSICGSDLLANQLVIVGVNGYIPFDQTTTDGSGNFCHAYTRSLSVGAYTATAFQQKGKNWLSISTNFLVTP